MLSPSTEKSKRINLLYNSNCITISSLLLSFHCVVTCRHLMLTKDSHLYCTVRENSHHFVLRYLENNSSAIMIKICMMAKYLYETRHEQSVNAVVQNKTNNQITSRKVLCRNFLNYSKSYRFYSNFDGIDGK